MSIVFDFHSINRILNRRTQIEAAKVEEPQPAAPQAPSPWIYGGPIIPSVEGTQSLYEALLNQIRERLGNQSIFITEMSYTYDGSATTSRNPLK